MTADTSKAGDRAHSDRQAVAVYAGSGLFLAATPGLEDVVAAEARAQGFRGARVVAGGVEVEGGWAEARRANLWLRTPGRVLVRLAAFRALHLAQLNKRARRIDWAGLFPPGAGVVVEAACRASRIYHQGAAAARVRAAITYGAGAVEGGEDPLRVMVRIDDDLCVISLDSSGAPLHRRGAKQAVVKAPLRETLAAAFLRLAGYAGDEPLIDPMCGSGTFLIEAAEIAAGLAPGRLRPFAFERLANHDASGWNAVKRDLPPAVEIPPIQGFDRDPGAIAASTANIERAGFGGRIALAQQPISALTRPPGRPGLVIVNPPYGSRIGNAKTLRGLYATLGKVMMAEFAGWRAAIVTSAPELARATGLPFRTHSAPIPHGGLRVSLWQTGPLG